MKARLVGMALAAAFVLPQTGNAQVRSGDIFFGGSAGTSSSEVRGGSINTDFKWGGMAGVMVGWRPSGSSVVGFETNWVQKGGKDLSLDYIEFPLTVGASGALGGGSVVGRFYTGIGFGFRVSCSSDILARNCDNANSTEWTWPVGVTIGNWSANRMMVALDARYSVGLSRTFENVSGQNYAWQIRLIIGKASFRR